MRVYLDSSTMIHFIEQTPQHGKAIKMALASRPLRLHWTYLTWLECRIKPLVQKNQALLAQFEMFFARPDITRIELSAPTFDRAAHLRARHRLKTPDALHLAAAIEGGCEEFWTNDHRLDEAASGYLRTVAL